MPRVAEIKKVARRVRRWAVKNRDRWPTDRALHCMCAITSFRIFTQLKGAGFTDVKLCATEEDDHVFVHCDGYVVDVTATQFNGYTYGDSYKAIEVLPITEATDDLWEAYKKLYTVEEMRVHFANWPDGQQPSCNTDTSSLYTKPTIVYPSHTFEDELLDFG